jgi:hypothetical protein
LTTLRVNRQFATVIEALMAMPTPPAALSL